MASITDSVEDLQAGILTPIEPTSAGYYFLTIDDPKRFRRAIGKHLIQVCATLSCSLCGAKTLVEHLKEKLQIDVGGTSADGMWTLEKAECIAACEGAPAIRIDENLYRGITPEKLDELMAQYD